MLTISKPLSSAQIRTYHAEEFSNARQNYYTQGDEIRGQWHGKLAREWGLAGDVQEAHVHRLAEGRHPITGDPLVAHQTARTYTDASGDRVSTMAHRAGWDGTFSAPKSVSLTALVGGDVRVAEAHRASVRVALDETERYVQARIGRNHPAETTGKWVAASFEHDSARPVDGYAAPQLHTHVVFFNMTERRTGETRALQPQELYKTQQYATALYRSELAARLTALGYEIERGASGQPEIRGYSPEYLEASSPRRQQIEDHLEQRQRSGAAAAQIAAHQTREAKGEGSHEAMQRRHAALAEAHGQQPARVVQAARLRADLGERHVSHITARGAVTYATDRNLEREAVVDERALMRDALTRSMGEVPVAAIKHELAERLAAGALIPVEQPSGRAGQVVTTPEMVRLERETIAAMHAGQQKQAPLVTPLTRQAVAYASPHLSDHQRQAVDRLLANRDQVVALEGVAGAGKTTALAAVREGAEWDGYRVEGFAPTSRAAQKLAEAGIATSTLQRHLARPDAPHDGQKHLYVLDESSLASTRQIRDFLQRLGPRDRVVLVGDVRQHQAVEAGRPYQQLQEAGLATIRLDDIVRQQDPALKQVVEQLARGDVRTAMQDLEDQGRVHEVTDRQQRFTAIAHAYAESPEGTLVVSPDNLSRTEINQAIHRLMQTAGRVQGHEQPVRILVARQEVTGADRQWAAQYEPGNVVRYQRGSQTVGLEAGEYARVAHVEPSENRVTVTRQSGERVTYDPRRLQGVTLYREAERTFAVGDRLQFTAPDRVHHVANRELATLQQVDAQGRLHVRLDSRRTVALAKEAQSHLDYGYAVTSHSSQGQTADRVLVHVDTERGAATLVNRRFAYVAVSRGRFDAQIYTDNRSRLGEALSREMSHASAIEVSSGPGIRSQAIASSPDAGRATALTVTRLGVGVSESPER
ncbi:MAG: MobF family relaxase [Acidobacteriota bacterium]